MREGVIIKIPDGSEPLAIRQGWLFLRFVFEATFGDDTADSMTNAPVTPRGQAYAVPEREAYRIMDNNRPGMADFLRKYTHPDLQGCPFVFWEDEIQFLPGTNEAWG